MSFCLVPLVVDYLRTHSLSELEAAHGVYARWDSEGTKFSLNYDQLEAVDADPLSQQCRGLILRPKISWARTGLEDRAKVVIGETRVLAWPMDRFFNHGQGSAAEVDLSDPKTVVYEKLDGTLCIVYFDDLKNKWCIATRSVCEADLPVDGWGNYTFDSLFREAFLNTSGQEFASAMTHMGGAGALTWCFELLTPENQVVVKHSDKRVVLLTVRGRDDGLEAHHPSLYAESINVPMAPSHRADSMDALVAFVNSRAGTDYEGVVACQLLSVPNENGAMARRVKIKSAAYLMASRIRTTIGASPRNVMELILLDQVDDLLPILSEDQKVKVETMRSQLRDFMHAYDLKVTGLLAEVASHGPLSDHVRRKTFARLVNQSEIWMGPAMAIYEGKAHGVHDWIMKHRERTNTKRFPSAFLETLCRAVEIHNRMA